MQDTKEIQCRDHAHGFFTVEAGRRGRPPVRCNENNPCTKSPLYKAKTSKVAPKKVTTRRATSSPKATATGIPQGESTYDAPEKRDNKSVPVALRAKLLLETEGWKLHARQRFDQQGHGIVEVTGIRGNETLLLLFVDGVAFSQDYNLSLDADPVASKDMDKRRKFDASEMTDLELVGRLIGRTVTWLNTIGNITETATIMKGRISIDHVFEANGVEAPNSRIVKFLSVDGGYRAFRESAIIDVR